MVKIKDTWKVLRNLSNRQFMLFLLSGAIFIFPFILDLKIPLIQKDFIDFSLKNRVLEINLLLLFAGMMILKQILSLFSYYLINRFSINAERELLDHYSDKLLKTNNQKIAQLGSAAFIDALMFDIRGLIHNTMSLSNFELLYSIIQVIFALFILWQINPLISMLCLPYLFFTLIMGMITSRRTSRIFEENRINNGEFYSEIADQLTNNQLIKENNAFITANRLIMEKYKTMSIGLLRSMDWNTFPQMFNALLKSLFFIGMLIIGIDSIIKGRMSYGDLLAVISYYWMLILPADEIVNTFQRFKFNEIYVKRLIGYEKESCYHTDIKEFRSVKNYLRIRFENLTYRYKVDDPLYELDFTLDKGMTGIVGLSGEGKSTLLKLIQRSIVPDSGRVLLDETPISEIPYQIYLSRFNILQQDVLILNKDLQFNLLLGRQLISDIQQEDQKQRIKKDIVFLYQEYRQFYRKRNIKKINQLYKKYQCMMECSGLIYKREDLQRSFNSCTYSDSLEVEPDINILTDRIFNQQYCLLSRYHDILNQTGLGKLQDRPLGIGGTFISGGEKQKIGLARFLLKEDFDFVILDEPFTGLDSIAVHENSRLLTEKIKNYTGLIISHNFSILRSFTDHFIVINQNRIESVGYHDDLIGGDNLYNQLYERFYLNHER